MHLFYSPRIDSDMLTLDEEETRHCTRVLRLTEGDTVYITDGLGTLIECRIKEILKKKCLLETVTRQTGYQKRNFKIHIAIAPTKNSERIEWFLEKTTEIGIDEITPVFCQYSERTHLKTERLKKVIISAMKQSLKTYLPVLNNSVDIETFLRNPFNGLKFIACCDNPDTVYLTNVYSTGKDTLILIGPEGDFSKDEIEMAQKEGFIPITLGKSRLRTETAGVVACTIINFLNQ